MAKPSFKRTAAFVAAFGIALAPATAGIALAQDVSTVAPVPAEFGGIDTAQDGRASLTIYKRALGTDELGPKATGEEMEDVPGTGLNGVTFKIERVLGLQSETDNIDINTDAGWKKLSEIANTDPVNREALRLDVAKEETTTGGTEAEPAGLATFSNLNLGLYLVTETEVPDGVVPGKPFFVFLPMTSASSDGTAEAPGTTTTWNYNPVVYPKNTESSVTKIVEDADQNLGDQVTYTITSDIPTLADDNTTILKYVVNDDLDEQELTVTAQNIKVALSNMIEGSYFEEGVDKDYVLTPIGPDMKVEITFTPAGLKKLTEAKSKDSAVQVVTTITADVTGFVDGIVVNDASTTTNNGGGGGDTHTPSNEVTTKWGKVLINKKNEDEEMLAGAKFELYRCDASGNLDIDPTTDGVQTDQISIRGVSEWTTSAEEEDLGTVVIEGLHVTDFEDNADLAETKNYCLVETQAPAGYAKLTQPIVFQLADDEDATTIIEYIADVVNVDDDDFLPSTGGMGVGLIIAVGAGLIGAGAYAARRNSQSA